VANFYEDNSLLVCGLFNSELSAVNYYLELNVIREIRLVNVLGKVMKSFTAGIFAFVSTCW